jgi:hypothetical protein
MGWDLPDKKGLKSRKHSEMPVFCFVYYLLKVAGAR